MGKVGKGKTRGKKVNPEHVKSETTKNRQTATPVSGSATVSFSYSSFPSVPSDSDEECCWQPSLALILIFKLLAPRIKRCRASADAELVEGS